MSFLTTQPERLAAAAGSLAGIGEGIATQNAGAAGPTTGVAPAASDPVSALTAPQFAAHTQAYQAIAAQAATVDEQLVATLRASAGRMRPPRRPTRLRRAERGLRR